MSNNQRFSTSIITSALAACLGLACDLPEESPDAEYLTQGEGDVGAEIMDGPDELAAPVRPQKLGYCKDIDCNGQDPEEMGCLGDAKEKSFKFDDRRYDVRVSPLWDGDCGPDKRRTA